MNNNHILMLFVSILLFFIPIVKYWFDISYSLISITIQAVLFIIIIFYTFLNKGTLYLQKQLTLYFLTILFLSIFVIMNYTYAEQVSFYQQKANAFMLNIFFPICILYFLTVIKKFNLEIFIKYTFYSGFLLTISSFHYILTNNISILNPSGVYFIEDNQILTGRLFGFHLILCIYILTTKNHILIRLLALIFTIFDIVFIFTAGSRQVILILAILGIYCLILFLKNYTKKTLIFIYIVLIISIFSLTKFVDYFSETYLFRRLETSMFQSDSRLNLYSDAFSITFKNITNFLFGIGFSDYKFVSSFAFDYPHNVALEVLVEMGIIGLFLLVFPIFYVIKKVTPMFFKFNNSLVVICYVSFCYFLLISLFSFNINSNNSIFIFGFICLYISSAPSVRGDVVPSLRGRSKRFLRA